MNNVNIIGRVGGEIELRYTPSGKAVTEVNLAVDDGFGDNKKTAWIGVTIWGATAECAAKYVKKGDRLGITGRLSQEEWEDKQTGKKQRKTKVTCQDMHLLMPKRDNLEPYDAPHQRGESMRKMHGSDPHPSPQDDDNEEIPF